MAEEKTFSLIDIFDDLGAQDSNTTWSYDAVGTLVKNNVPGNVADDTEYSKVENLNLKKKARKIEQKLLSQIREGKEYDIFIKRKNNNYERLKRKTKIDGIYIPASKIIIDGEWLACEVREEVLSSNKRKKVGRQPKWDWLKIHIEIQRMLYLKDTQDWTARSIAKDVCKVMKGKNNVTKSDQKDDQAMPDLDDVRKAVSSFIHLYEEVHETKIISDPP